MPEYNFLLHATVYSRLYFTHRSNTFRHKLPSLGRLSLVSKIHCKTNAYLSSIKQYKTHLLKSNTAQNQVKTFVCLFVCFWHNSPQWVMASSFTRFLDQTQRRTNSRYDTSGRVISSSQRPLPGNTQHSQQTSMPPVEFEPKISAGERPQTYALDSVARGIGKLKG